MLIKVAYLLAITWSGILANREAQINDNNNINLTNSPKNLPCPSADDIKPCLCSVTEDYHMIMDCSNVSSEEELLQVFTHEFPFYNFHKLVIKDNDQLNLLAEKVFGNATFTEVHITNTTIIAIREEVFQQSQNTLESLYLDGNIGFTFTLGEMSSFTKLFYVSIQAGALQFIPDFNSQSLKVVIMDGTPLGNIDPARIRKLLALEVVSLQNCGVEQISTGTFANNTNLSVVNLGSNNLTSLPHNAVVLHGPNAQLSIRNNQIKNLQTDAFSGVKTIMDARNNSLKELTEELFRPVLENEAYLTIEDNPFLCGCDIAWLILDRELLARVADRPTCSSGEAFVDLDPAIYEELC